MSFMERMPIQKKLAIMVAVPVIGLLFFLQLEIRRELAVRNESGVLLYIAETSVAISALVHELQKERGMSAGYLGSKGAKFSDKLPEQHQLTDNRIDALRQFLSEAEEQVSGSKVGQEFISSLRTSVEDLERVPDMRKGILGLTVSTSDGIGFYTSLNSNFLNLANFVAKNSSNGRLASVGAAYVAFLQAKERAGIERAVLANVFARDQFTPALYRRFEALVVIQDTYLAVFRSLASDKNVALLESALSGPEFNETQKLRQIARDKADTGGFNVDSTYWFSMQTKKINKLKEIDDQLSEDIIDVAGELLGNANSLLVTLIVIALAIVLLVLAMTIVIVRGILRTLGADPMELDRVLKAIAADNLDVDIKQSKPCTGVMASAQIMQNNLKQRIKADREALQVNSRIKRALDTVEGNVMIADTEHNIIYINDSMQPFFENAQAELQRSIPQFNARSIIGKPVSMFFDGTSGSTESIAAISAVAHKQLIFGDLTFDVIVSPVFSDANTRIGTVLEWTDRTSELKAQKNVQDVINAACAGDLTARIDPGNMTGFFNTLSGGVNQMLGAIEKLINDMSRVMAAVAKGNLGEYIDSEYQGSFQNLKNDTNSTVAQLTRVIYRLQETSRLVKTGAGEITNGNAILNQRAEEQASSLQETSASMTEMTKTVKQNAENAKNANNLALNAREQAEEGGSVVNRAVKAMLDIDSSSKEISDIIGVIDEIAFQTNLLALNASVEAARAGEHGRGFAVVASEVRNLAGRSANAANEIKDIIQDSSVKVADGSRLVNESGEMLQEIVNCVNRVTKIVGEITEASQDQSVGIDQVNGAVTMMEELTQQNAALVEEATAASESLGKQATELDQLTSFFNGLKDVDIASNDEASVSAQPFDEERRREPRPWSDEQGIEERKSA